MLVCLRNYLESHNKYSNNVIVITHCKTSVTTCTGLVLSKLIAIHAAAAHLAASLTQLLLLPILHNHCSKLQFNQTHEFFSGEGMGGQCGRGADAGGNRVSYDAHVAQIDLLNLGQWHTQLCRRWVSWCEWLHFLSLAWCLHNNSETW